MERQSLRQLCRPGRIQYLGVWVVLVQRVADVAINADVLGKILSVQVLVVHDVERHVACSLYNDNQGLLCLA